MTGYKSRFPSATGRVAALAAVVLLLAAGPAGADVSLPGEQHIGDDELGGTFVPLDPVLFDRMGVYPTHFHLTEEVTVTEVRFEGLVMENDNGRPYVTIDGTDYSGNWDAGNDTLALDPAPTLAPGLHTLAVTSDCIKSNGGIGNCTGVSRTENDLSFSEMTLVTQSGAATQSMHWVRRRHAGDGQDLQDDDYEDLGNSGQEPFFYPDSGEGGPITVGFSLGADTYFNALWMFRLREVTGSGGELTLRRGGTEVWSDTITGDSPDLQDTPAAFPIDTTLEAGDYTLEIAASEDFSWDSVILKAPGPTSGTVGLGGFNALEPGADAIDGPLHTKVSGGSFDVDLVSLNNAGNPQNFNGDVELELVDATSASDCADLTAVASLGTATFNNESRTTVSGLTYGNAIGAARIRVTEANPGGNSAPAQGCSQDSFTVRPHHLTVEARDADWETAGTGRRLDGTNDAACQAAGGSEPCHKAGRAFTLEGAAFTAGGTAVSGFDQATSMNWGLMEPPHDGGDTLGTRSPSQVTFAGDSTGYRTDSASYEEVGVLELTLTDQGNFAARSGDRSDDHCVTGSSSNDPSADPAGEGRFGCQAATEAPATAGRFVPDRFELAHSGFAFEPACAGGSTYFGEPFGWAGAPEVVVTAVAGDGSTTRNYEDPFWRLPDFADRYEDDSGTEEAADDGDDHALDASGATHQLPDTAETAGQATIPYQGTLVYDRPSAPAAPIGAGDQWVKLRFDVEDGDGIRYEGGASPPTYEISPIRGAGPVRFGRLALENAHGSELTDLNVPARAEYYDGERFVANREDDCTPISMSGAADAVRLQLDDGGSWVAAEGEVGLLGGTGGTTQGTATTGLAGGYGTLTLAAPGEGSTGYVDVRADLVELPWLEVDRDGDGSFTEYPQVRATFGRYRGDDRILYWQEVFP
ncbi:DUF6701 domain-containing protein [Thiohalorhabdus denitrificans]|nr:DUF6701 domain-containing protein [Thiohalorhabdus denitrificans]